MKKTLKLFLSLLLVFAVVLGMMACSDTDDQDSDGATEEPDGGDEEPDDGGHEHEYEWETTKAATCAESGEERRICKNCQNVSETRAINPIPHTSEAVLTDENYQLIHESTCTKYGSYKYICKYGAGTEQEHWVEVTAYPPDKSIDVLESMSDEQRAMVEKKPHEKEAIDIGEQCTVCESIWSKDLYKCGHVGCRVYNEDRSSYCTYCGTKWGKPVILG